MKDERTQPKQGEAFLSRWSRLKKQDAPSEGPIDARPAPATAAQDQAETPPPELPPVDTLTIDSNYADFLHPKVEENVRRAALKKLFSDPHFNVMDGLDVYIDDYSKSDPLPAEMLAQLKHGQQILAWAREKPRQLSEDAPAAESDVPPVLTAEDTPPSPDAPPAAEQQEPGELAAHELPDKSFT